MPRARLHSVAAELLPAYSCSGHPTPYSRPSSRCPRRRLGLRREVAWRRRAAAGRASIRTARARCACLPLGPLCSHRRGCGGEPRGGASRVLRGWDKGAATRQGRVIVWAVCVTYTVYRARLAGCCCWCYLIGDINQKVNPFFPVPVRASIVCLSRPSLLSSAWGTLAHTRAVGTAGAHSSKNSNCARDCAFLTFARVAPQALPHVRQKEFYNKTPSHDTRHGTGAHWH